MILAFWTDADPERVDRIFRSSGLYREKWERADYRSATIAKATGFLSETISGFIARKRSEEAQEMEVAFVKAWYALTGENLLEECYLLYGATTRNGKSTLLDAISHAFGDYAMTIQPETLAQQKDRSSRTASGDIARLDGARLLQMSEPPKKMQFDVALLKTLLGRDIIVARHLYQRETQFVPVFKLLINTNYLPLVTDDTLFSSGRVKVVPFLRHFEPSEQDAHLKRKLKQEQTISAIFNWCLAGLRKFREAGCVLNEPSSVIQATKEYRLKSDKIQNFIDECLRESPNENTAGGLLYDVFSAWCRSNGFGTENKSNFFADLKTKGLLSPVGTVNGKTQHNVVRGFVVDEVFLPYRDGTY